MPRRLRSRKDKKAVDASYWFPKINANFIVVRLIDFYELRLPRRLRLLAMIMFSCVSLRATRSNLVITCENDYICEDFTRHRFEQSRKAAPEDIVVSVASLALFEPVSFEMASVGLYCRSCVF